jgi:hypothetical protein
MLDSSRTINGSFGECWHEGNWLTNFYKGSAEVEITKSDIKKSGSRWMGKKITGLAGTGTITGYRITSELMESVSSIADDSKAGYKTELIFKLDDPEAFGAERVRLKNVSFDKIPLVNYEVGTVIEDEWAFTFEGYELLDLIKES